MRTEQVQCYLCVHNQRKRSAMPCRKCKRGSSYQPMPGISAKNEWCKGIKRYTGPGTDEGKRKADGQAQTRRGGRP